MSVQTLFLHYLHQLESMVLTIERHQQGEEQILSARLAADMFPLAMQAKIAINFALRGCCPLAGVAKPDFFEAETSFNAISRQCRRTIEYLQGLPPITPTPDQQIEEQVGHRKVSLPAEQFIQQLIAPNFLFHLSMAYAIARAEGVPLGKGDFDGFHLYPSGFSFE